MVRMRDQPDHDPVWVAFHPLVIIEYVHGDGKIDLEERPGAIGLDIEVVSSQNHGPRLVDAAEEIAE